jgi:hypothetical protein
MKKNSLLPPMLLSFASLLFLYSTSTIDIYPGDFFRPLIILWLVLLVLTLPAYWVTRDWRWAGLLLVVVVLGLFCNSIFTYAYLIVIVLSVAVVWGGFRFILKRDLKLEHIFRVINSVSLLVILLTIYNLRTVVTTIPATYYSSTWDAINSKRYLPLTSSVAAKPDIYFIVLDEYARSDILQDFYSFDNSEFIDLLRQKGFTIPDHSRANYPRTVLSITSALNMDYIDNFAPNLNASDMRWLLSPWLDHNLVRTSLERLGYSSVSISTDWGITDNPTTDYYFKSHPIILTEFERYILSATPLKMLSPLFEHLASVPTFEAHRQSQQNNFTALTHIAGIDGPKFVFAHIMLPHPPFIFARDGSPRTSQYSFSLVDGTNFPGSDEEFRDQYVEQMQYLNNQLTQVIESILQNSKSPPIIILQADHGTRRLTKASAAKTCMREAFSTFSAYYLPGVEPDKVPEDITTVNIFRIVLNEYFDARLPLLENAQYYPGTATGYFDFEDVTNLIDQGNNCNRE